MKKLLALTILIFILSGLWAGGTYATGASLTLDSASNTSQVGLFLDNDNLVVTKDKETWINPLLTNHFDLVFSGLFKDDGLEQIAFSYIGGAGAAFKPTSSLYINLSLEPSVFTTFGSHDGTFGVGIGGVVSFAYVFSDPGFMLKGGFETSYTLLFDSSNPMMVGGFVGLGFKI